MTSIALAYVPRNGTRPNSGGTATRAEVRCYGHVGDRWLVSQTDLDETSIWECGMVERVSIDLLAA
jgi:hypothetical protein